MTDYEKKEFYITTQPNYEAWAKHANVGILNLYSNYIFGNVLDVGCNHGGSATYWVTKNPRVTSITGLDVQEQVKPIFLNLMSSVSIPVNFIQVDFTVDIELPTKYDTITSFHTLEHIIREDVPSFVNNMFRNLNEGGCVIISIPYMHHYEDPHHVVFYDEKLLTKTFTSAGFTTVECLKDDRWEMEKNLLTAVFKK